MLSSIKISVVTVVILASVAVAWHQRSNSDPILPVYPAAFMQADFYERAFAMEPKGQPDPSIKAIVVNHHLLAPFLIAQAMEHVRTDDPVTVVLISPDHFGRGRAPVTSVVAYWDTPFGVLEPDTRALALLASGGLDLYAYPFTMEHGIFSITGFIKHELPHARLVPIIVKTNAPNELVDRVAQDIHALPGTVIVVGSFDFTHDSTMVQAEANDLQSIAILGRGDVDQASHVVADSHAGVRLLMRYAALAHVQFSLLATTNSARITGNHGQTDTTSYITGYWEPLSDVVH